MDGSLLEALANLKITTNLTLIAPSCMWWLCIPENLKTTTNWASIAPSRWLWWFLDRSIATLTAKCLISPTPVITTAVSGRHI